MLEQTSEVLAPLRENVRTGRISRQEAEKLLPLLLDALVMVGHDVDAFHAPTREETVDTMKSAYQQAAPVEIAWNKPVAEQTVNDFLLTLPVRLIGAFYDPDREIMRHNMQVTDRAAILRQMYDDIGRESLSSGTGPPPL